MVWNVRTEYSLSKAKSYVNLADLGSQGRRENEGRTSCQIVTGGGQSGEEGWPHFVTPLAWIMGQGQNWSASCKCSHLISQLTKYYDLTHKNQSVKLPGVLNSRSCDQKQVGPGDRSGEVVEVGQELPLDPVALSQPLKQVENLVLAPKPTSASCLSTVRAFRGVPSLRSRGRATSKQKIIAFKPYKSMKISGSRGKNPSSATWMFEPRFFCDLELYN